MRLAVSYLNKCFQADIYWKQKDSKLFTFWTVSLKSNNGQNLCSQKAFHFKLKSVHKLFNCYSRLHTHTASPKSPHSSPLCSSSIVNFPTAINNRNLGILLQIVLYLINFCFIYMLLFLKMHIEVEIFWSWNNIVMRVQVEEMILLQEQIIIEMRKDMILSEYIPVVLVFDLDEQNIPDSIVI